MDNLPTLLIDVLGIFGAGVGVYAGIKSDLTKSIMKADAAHSAANDAKSSAHHAHRRLDDHITSAHIQKGQ